MNDVFTRYAYNISEAGEKACNIVLCYWQYWALFWIWKSNNHSSQNRRKAKYIKMKETKE